MIEFILFKKVKQIKILNKIKTKNLEIKSTVYIND